MGPNFKMKEAWYHFPQRQYARHGVGGYQKWDGGGHTHNGWGAPRAPGDGMEGKAHMGGGGGDTDTGNCHKTM